MFHMGSGSYSIHRLFIVYSSTYKKEEGSVALMRLDACTIPHNGEGFEPYCLLFVR